jgi:hypothetical protein
VRCAGALAIAALCSLGAGCRRLPPNVNVSGEREQVEIRNTLPPLLGALEVGLATTPHGPREAWLAYEAAHGPLLSAAGAQVEDPGEAQLHKLAASAEALLALMTPVSEAGPGEAQRLVEAFEEKLGGFPPMTVAFGASRGGEQAYRGAQGGRPLLFLNARHPLMGPPGARQALLARELFGAWQRARGPEGARMDPLAGRVWREGAAHFAARTTVPDLREPDLFGIDEKRLAAMRSRQALLARELLAGLDSSSEAELERFFSDAVKDPLLPLGSGPFISERLYQRLAADLGSLERPLKLSPAEFLQRARPALQAMAGQK